MGAGLHEYPLIFFTVIGQSVAGAFILMGAVLLLAKPTAQQHRRIVFSMLGLWLLMGVGFLMSMLHMGSPLRAFNSMLRFGYSALSNEIVSGSAFFGLGGLYWLLSVLNKMPAIFEKLWLILTMILAGLFIYAISRVYQIETVTTWFNLYSGLQFILTSFIAGPVLAACLLNVASYELKQINYFVLISLVGVILSSIIVTTQAFELGSIQSSVKKASELVPDYPFFMGWRTVSLSFGLACWLYSIMTEKISPKIGILLSLFFILIGEFIGRALFYGLHMTVGMAVVG